MLNGARKRFFVDPQDASWHQRLRSEIAIALGIGSERHPSINIAFPNGPMLTGTLAELDKLASLPDYQLVVTLNERAPSASSVSAAPTYRLPAPYSSAAAPSASAPIVAVNEYSGGQEVSSGEARKLAQELVYRLRDNVARSVPERVAALKYRDFGTVRATVMDELSRPEFYGGDSAYQAFWGATASRDAGAAITDLSTDIASKMCKISENLAGGSHLTPALYHKVLIGCSIWDSWRDKVRSWKSRHPSRVPVPFNGYSGECLFKICAPIGAAAVDAVKIDLIAASLQCPYIGHGRDDDDGYSSDEHPSAASIRCAGRKKHYHSRPVERSIRDVPCTKKKIASKAKPLDIISTLIAAPVDPLFDALTPIACKSCGHGCPVCGVPLSVGCEHVAKPKPIECGACDSLEVVIDDGGNLPPHGQTLLEVTRRHGKPNGVEALNVRYSFAGMQNELDPFVGLRLGASQTKQVKAGKYRVVVEDAASKKVLAEETEMLLIQRNRYALIVDPEFGDTAPDGSKRLAGGALVLVIMDRFEKEKLALASEFLAREDLNTYLRAHPSGVLFAPSNTTLSDRDVSKIAISEYFASGVALELMRKETANGFTASKEMRITTDGKRAFVRNSENTKIWNCEKVRNCNIEGVGQHPLFPQIIVIVVDLLPTDVERSV